MYWRLLNARGCLNTTLVLHLGGNDLPQDGCTELLTLSKIARFCRAVAWVNLLTHRIWCDVHNPKAMDVSRCKVVLDLPNPIRPW